MATIFVPTISALVAVAPLPILPLSILLVAIGLVVIGLVSVGAESCLMIALACPTYHSSTPVLAASLPGASALLTLEVVVQVDHLCPNQVVRTPPVVYLSGIRRRRDLKRLGALLQVLRVRGVLSTGELVPSAPGDPVL